MIIRCGSVTIVGTSPLLVLRGPSRFCGKLTVAAERHRHWERTLYREGTPEGLFGAARYKNEAGWDGYPVIGIQSSMASACRLRQMLAPLVRIVRRGVVVRPDGCDYRDVQPLVRIEGEAIKRIDTTRLLGHNNQIRVSAEYPEWRVALNVRWDGALFNMSEVRELLILAGQCCGLGLSRPERNGSFGTFAVMSAIEKDA